MKHTPTGGAAPILIGGMEACWMASALGLIEARVAPGALPVPWLLLGIPIAFLLRRLARTLPRRLRPAAWLIGGLVWVLLPIKVWAFPAQTLSAAEWLAGLAAALAQGKGGPNAVQVSALAAAAAWIAGLRLAGLRSGYDQILGEFQFGLLVLLFVFFCAAQWGSALPGMTAVVLAFFVLFLLGMTAGRSRDAGGWWPGEARTRWFVPFLFNAALVVGVGALLTSAVTPGVLALILDFLEALWNALVEWVARCIAFLAQLLPSPEIKPYGSGGGAGPVPPKPSSLPDLLRIPDYVRHAAGFFVSAFWVVLFAVCLWRMASQIAAWLRRHMHDLEAAQIEALPGSFRRDLRRRLRWVRRRAAGWMAWLRYALGRKPCADALPAEAAAVRRMYRRLLAWSAAGGCPRQRHQTPHEFIGRLCEWLPAARTPLTQITAHYTAVRYGSRQPGAEVVAALECAWRDVRQSRKTIRRPHRGDTL